MATSRKVLCAVYADVEVAGTDRHVEPDGAYLHGIPADFLVNLWHDARSQPRHE